MLTSVISDFYQAWKRERQQRRLTRTERIPPKKVRTQDNASASWRIFGRDCDLQRNFDVAVVMPTVLRSSVQEAVKSVFAQSRSIRIQLLIGIDVPLENDGVLVRLLQSSPANVTSIIFYPGYSTSVRHGGVHLAKDGGSLRSVLTHLANARRIAYLDDDNRWHEDHLQAMFAAMEGKDWAYTLRWFVHPQTRQPVCQDIWESLGPGQGIYTQKFGGWVDPNCLMFDKIACEGAVRWWCIPLFGDEKGMSADRRVYDFLQRHGEPGRTNVPTVYYTLQPDDSMHPTRLGLMGDAYAQAERLTAGLPG